MTVPAQTYATPIVDDDNPCYCPALPAAAFLSSLRQKHAAAADASHTTHELAFALGTHGHDVLRVPAAEALDEDPRSTDHPPSLSFAQLLDQSVREDEDGDDDDLLGLICRRPMQPVPRLSPSSEGTSEEDSSLDSIYPVPPRHAQLQYRPDARARDRRGRGREARAAHVLDRARSKESFSDLHGPLRHERSMLAVNEGSFELSAKADRIQYFPGGHTLSDDRGTKRLRVYSGSSAADADWGAHVKRLNDRIRALEDDLYGPPVGTESPRGIKHFIARLDRLLPGIRLKEKLYALEATSHQRIADVLATEGSLDARVLSAFRQSEIESVDLSASAVDAGGLNLGAYDLLRVFGKPNSFLFLSELSLSGMRLCDGDVLHIQHLPRLARLWLGSTGIGNEAIFLLTSLKRSLVDLDVAYNARIGDDAVPALLVLVKLRYVSLLDTGVTMSGMRRLATTYEEAGRAVGVEVPKACEEYLAGLSRTRSPTPGAQPTATSDPAAVDGPALERNVAARAEGAEGEALVGLGASKRDVKERLRWMLERRRGDGAVRRMVYGR